MQNLHLNFTLYTPEEKKNTSFYARLQNFTPEHAHRHKRK